MAHRRRTRRVADPGLGIRILHADLALESVGIAEEEAEDVAEVDDRPTRVRALVRRYSPGRNAPLHGNVGPMVTGGVRYDEIGRSYAVTRREDPRIAAPIWRALGAASTIVNVGAGTGNYEPPDRRVVAVEPSLEMIGQRAGRSHLVVRCGAELLPFRPGAFDAALAVLTLHHWRDAQAGLAEMRRVAERQVILYFEPLRTTGFWVLDYFTETADVPSEQNPPGESLISDQLDIQDIQIVEVPADCTDGFGAAYWSRPEAYLDPRVQAGMSWLALQPEAARRDGTERLARDLRSGRWDDLHGHLRTQRSYDGGYRLAIAGS
ncbi:MAG: SAM-dependent methyltransferase [Ilumatobacteraceae bacterium]|nr:SAM-dependent methyltransferase [Ilumatobacteraceae bacterium]